MERTQRQEHRQALHQLSRRYTLMLSAVVGVLAGLLAVLFRLLVEQTESIRSTISIGLWERSHFAGAAFLILSASLLGALAAWLTRQYCPEAGGSGIPHVKAVLISARPLRPVRLILVKLGAGIMALASGMSLGREGPTVHIGGACAAEFASLARLPGRTRRALIAAGAGAGLAAAFNAPLAGFLFIMEELRRDMSRGTYGNALVTAVSSVGVTRMLTGYEPTFALPDVQPLPLNVLPFVALVGVVAALVGRLFNVLLLKATEKQRSPIWSGALVGALAGVLVLVLPEVTGGGHAITQRLLNGEVTTPEWFPYLLLLLSIKLIFTVLCYGTGVPGGIFAPLLTMGAILGYFMSHVFGYFAPIITPTPARMATIGMAAVLTASVRAPLTGVVLIVEMTGQYHMLYSLLLAAFVSYALSEAMKNEPIYEALLARDLRSNKDRSTEEARVLEVTIEPGSLLDGARIDKIRIPEDLLIAVIERNSHIVVPHGSTRLEAGDFVTVVAGPGCGDSQLGEFLEATH